MGINRRAEVAMTADEVQRFLAAEHRMTLGTLLADGSIHLVTMHYALFDGRVGCLAKIKSQKVRNVQRHPHASCLVETGDGYATLRGVSIAGTVELVTDSDVLLHLALRIRERLNDGTRDADPALAELGIRNRVALVVALDRIASWDHAKVPLPPSRGGLG